MSCVRVTVLCCDPQKSIWVAVGRKNHSVLNYGQNTTASPLPFLRNISDILWHQDVNLTWANAVYSVIAQDYVGSLTHSSCLMSINFHSPCFPAGSSPFAVDMGDICLCASLKWQPWNFGFLNGFAQIFSSQDCPSIKGSNSDPLANSSLAVIKVSSRRWAVIPISGWWAKQLEEGRCSCQKDRPLASSSLAKPVHALGWRAATWKRAWLSEVLSASLPRLGWIQDLTSNSNNTFLSLWEALIFLVFSLLYIISRYSEERMIISMLQMGKQA